MWKFLYGICVSCYDVQESALIAVWRARTAGGKSPDVSLKREQFASLTHQWLCYTEPTTSSQESSILHTSRAARAAWAPGGPASLPRPRDHPVPCCFIWKYLCPIVKSAFSLLFIMLKRLGQPRWASHSSQTSTSIWSFKVEFPHPPSPYTGQKKDLLFSSHAFGDVSQERSNSLIKACLGREKQW